MIFTYNNGRDCLTNNKHQRLVGATVPPQFALVGVTISGLNALSEGTKEKRNQNRDQIGYYEF